MKHMLKEITITGTSRKEDSALHMNAFIRNGKRENQNTVEADDCYACIEIREIGHASVESLDMFVLELLGKNTE